MYTLPSGQQITRKVRNTRVEQFLDFWNFEISKYSTQDQISFPFVLQQMGLVPYSLPDETVVGNMDYNSWYIKLDHGM